jgi:hypothetical protein
MDVNKALQFADELVFEHTQKHLDNVQRAVIEGAWYKETYEEIEKKSNISQRHLSDVGYQLWQLLSQLLGEDIKKNNFRSTLERITIKTAENSNNIFIDTNNHCISQTINQHNEANDHNQTTSKSTRHDLTFAPQIIKFYNRENELKTLSNWILNKNTRLISVLGLSGIGKSYLVRRFVDLNLEQFEVIIWKNLKLTPSFNQILAEILATVETSEVFKTSEVCQVLNLLKSKRCLIILDHVENIFLSGQFAGEYQSEYQNYQNFFKTIVETEHQSNIILISQEQCQEMHCLDEELYPIKCLELSGLDDVTSLDFLGLKDENNCLKLIELYQGNPTYLKSIAMTIRKNYDSIVKEFLAENNLLITKDMQFNFNQLFNRLSPLEQQIVLQLAKFEHPISREDLRQTLDLSSTNFSNALQSLQERYLVKKLTNEQTLFDLDAIFKEYIKNR